MTFYFAIMLGLIGSAHCVAMCGGLISAINLHSENIIRTPRQNYAHNISLHLGRITSYLLLGLIFSGLASVLKYAIPIPHWGEFMRVFVVLIMLLVGAQLVWQKSPLSYIEIYANKLWNKINWPFKKLLPAQTLGQSYLLGLLWGLLPCGLVYGLLLVAMAGSSVWYGGLLMLAFGVGTLPALLITGVAALYINRYFQKNILRKTGGILIILVALWTLCMPLLINHTNLYISPYFQGLTLC